MHFEVKKSEQNIINKLTTLLEVKYVYKVILETTENKQILFIVILKGNCSSLTKELSSMVSKIFQEETEFLYRILSFEYAQQQLKEENLFFIHGCHSSNLIYKSTESDTGLKVPPINKETKKEMELDFENELSRVGTFMEGVKFYMEKDNISLAAFMLHQYMEIWYRNAELLVMGKERKTHSLKEHQTYIKTFSQELGSVFNMDREEDRELLRLIDDAYITTRYFKNYHITKSQLEIISEKAWHLNFVVAYLYGNKLEACMEKIGETEHLRKSDIEPCRNEDVETQDPKMKLDTDATFESLTDYEKIRDKIQKLLKRKEYMLKPGSNEFYYKANFLVSGPTDILYDIAGIMKVCIIALEHGDNSYGSLIPQPHANIQTTLEHILQLLPFEEVECLEKIINQANFQGDNGKSIK